MLKINNVVINENIFFSEKGGNMIYAKDCKEEFFGVYNLSLQNGSILCEGSSSNLVYCDLLIDNKLYSKIPFNVIKSNDSKITINKNTLLGGSTKTLIDENKTDIYSEIVSDLDDGYRTKEQLVELLKESEQDKKQISKEVVDIKRQLEKIQNKKEVIVENKVPNEFLNYKQEMLKEFFKVTNENEFIIENKFQTLKEELESKLNEFSIVGLDFLKKENSETIRDIVNEFYQEISESNREEIKSFRKILKEESSILEEKYDSKLKNQIDLYSDINSKLFESVESAKKDTKNVLSEQIKQSKESLLDTFNESLENHKKDFSEKFISKFEEIIKKREEEIKNKTKGILDEHNKNVNNLLETNRKEIIDASEKLLEESNKKVKELSKKVETLNNQLNKANNEKKRIDSLLQDARKYTDTKMAQMLEESKRFTRVMMDMVGGGSGSVAVQYAAGGNINGDLTVNGTLSSTNIDVGNFEFSGGTINGNLDVTGIISGTSILSGGVPLTEIFAGEGEGDTNTLDGGTI